MNDDYTNNNYYSNENNTTPEPAASEPYRYKYENGEKTDTYNYNTSYSYGNTYGTSPVTVEATPKKKRFFRKALRYVAAAACFGVIASAAFLGTSYLASDVFGIQLVQENRTSNGVQTSGNGSINGTQTNITLGVASTIESAENPAESVVVQVVEQNLAATVAVNSTYIVTGSYWGQQYQQEQHGSGSGFIVGKNDTELLIATNNHVIDDATKIEVTFIDDTKLEAAIKGNDSIADLAIIAVPLESIPTDTLSAIRVATLGDSDSVRLGEMAIAIGNALGYGQSVTVGYISAKDRSVTIDGNEMILLQTDAAINGGNSGGPLFNTRGEVIGINSAKYADTDVEGMCFAIPISRAIPILNELMTREVLAEEDRGYLGIQTRSVTESISSFYGWPVGAYIASVLENSPAEQANLYMGDIVTKVNGIQITTADQLVSAISSYRYGTTVELTVQRFSNGKYEEIIVPVTLARKADVEASAESGSQTETSDTSSSGNSSNSSDGRRQR